MRQITDHIVSGDQAVQVRIEVTDKPGAGGANHRYEISGCDISKNPSSDAEWFPLRTYIMFQNGPVKENGVNGITNEALMAIVIDRLRSFQNGPFKCRENAIALTHMEEALMWLQRRTVERIKRGVEGTNQQ